LNYYTSKGDFYKNFYDNAPDMFICVDRISQKIIECNQACSDKLGYTKEELLNMESVARIYHQDCYEDRLRMVELYDRTGVVNDMELILLNKSGDKCYVSLSLKAVKDEDNRVLYSRGIFRDITRLIEKRKKIRALNKELSIKNQDLATLFHILSHDIQSSLRIIKHSSEWIAGDEGSNFSSNVFKYLSMLKNATKQIYDTTQKVLKLFMSDFVEDPSITNLTHLLAEIKSRLLLNDDVKIILNTDKDSFKTYKHLLTEVLYNLIGNAIKHHNQPEYAKILLNITSLENSILIEVQDNGPGIPKTLQRKIFEPFQSFNKNVKEQGFGLGLTIVKKILKKLNSSIEIKSMIKCGTSFSFTWPVFE